MCARAQHFYFVGNREQQTHLYGTTAHLSFQSMDVCVCVDAGSSPLFSRLLRLVGWFLGWAGSVGGSFQTSKALGEKRRGEKRTKGEKRLLLPSTDNDFSIFPSSSLAAIVFRFKMH